MKKSKFLRVAFPLAVFGVVVSLSSFKGAEANSSLNANEAADFSVCPGDGSECLNIAWGFFKAPKGKDRGIIEWSSGGGYAMPL